MGSLNDIINGKSNKEKKTGVKRGSVVMLHIDQLVPNEDNKRSFGDREKRNIDVLADELLISGRVLENLIVRKTDDGDKYLILSGHRRYYASKRNAEAGHAEFSELPCEITDESDAMSYYNLLIANLSTEPLTEHEKMTSTMHLRDVLPELLGDDELKGRRLREKIADTLHVSQTKIAQYENISNNLDENAMNLFEKQELNVSTANELAGLPDDVQQEFVKDGVVPEMSDVKTVKQELKTIRSYAQMTDQEKREIAFILDNLLINTDLKRYRDAIEKMGLVCLSSESGAEGKLLSSEKYAAEVASMLLYYRESRQFVGKDAAMYIFRSRRVTLSRYNCHNPIELSFSYNGFFNTFCEIYREEILKHNISAGESGQMQIDDYDENDPYEQIIPQEGSCDGKCFNCRNTECHCYQAPRDRCIYFDKIDCTIPYVFGSLKKDFPDLYEKCTGCCMNCSVSDACKYACSRKDMSIIRERAGIHEELVEEKHVTRFSVPKEEAVLALKSLMSRKNMNHAYLYLKETPFYEVAPEKFSGSAGYLDHLKSECTLNKELLSAHPCWTSAEALGKGRYKVIYAYGELTNTQEIMYDVHTVIDILRRAIAIGYFGDDEEMQYVRYRPVPGEAESFIDGYDQWKKWFELPQIGATYYRVVMDDECQIVAVAYASAQKITCNVEYYYISSRHLIDNIFNEFKISRDDLINRLKSKSRTEVCNEKEKGLCLPEDGEASDGVSGVERSCVR